MNQRDPLMPDLERNLTTEERDALDFVLGLRRRWARELYPALEAQWAATGATAEDHVEAAEQLHALPLYPWFSQVERYQQKMLWRAVGDAVLARRSEIETATAAVAGRTDGGATLELDDDLELPAWYADVDIHVQPGGVWSHDLCAHVYELGARIVMLRDNDEYGFHSSFVRTAFPPVDGAGPQRVVDLGCGFGKSTWPLALAYPDAEIIGIDLSAPNLRLAHAHAIERGLSIRNVQGDVSRTGLADDSVDVVTASMLLHELPTEVLRAVLAEAVRILRPGGVLRFLEFCPTGDPVRDATVYEHGDRNNEPFFPELFDADTVGWLTDAGLTDVAWVPFDERGAGLSPDGWGDRSEWHFPWAVLRADKPAVAGTDLGESADRQMEAAR